MVHDIRSFLKKHFSAVADYCITANSDEPRVIAIWNDLHDDDSAKITGEGSLNSAQHKELHRMIIQRVKKFDKLSDEELRDNAWCSISCGFFHEHGFFEMHNLAGGYRSLHYTATGNREDEEIYIEEIATGEKFLLAGKEE